jgi:PilZ domain.
MLKLDKNGRGLNTVLMIQAETAVSRREFQRHPCDLKIGYELVKWNDAPSGSLRKPRYARGVNISVSGLGLSEAPDLDRGAVKSLISGKEKIRLALYPDGEESPILLFARMAWSVENGQSSAEGTGCGFNFIDVSPDSYRRLTLLVGAIASGTPAL